LHKNCVVIAKVTLSYFQKQVFTALSC